MVDEHTQAPPTAGGEPVHDGDQVLDAVEPFPHHALDAEIVARAHQGDRPAVDLEAARGEPEDPFQAARSHEDDAVRFEAGERWRRTPPTSAAYS